MGSLGAFSLAFTRLAQAGLWPRTPSGFLKDSDLGAGLTAGAALLVLLLWKPRGPAVPPA